MTPRQRLRAVVWEMTSGFCEWPGCDLAADELAHIRPRGMGHTGYRDILTNVMAACTLHARVTDDGSAPEWVDIHHGYPGTLAGARNMLGAYVQRARRQHGYDVDAMMMELEAR